MKVLEEGWLSENEHTQRYIDENTERLQQADNLLLDLTSLEIRKNASIKSVLHDFGIRYRSGDIEDVDGYLKLLEEKGADRIFLEVLIETDRFETLRDRLDEYLQKSLEMPNIREDLQAFVEKLGQERPTVEDAKAKIANTEHSGFIHDICKFLILNPENKTNCVIIYGAPNTGKTKFLQALSKVLNLIYYKQTRGHFDCKYKSGKRQPHFIICEEGCFKKLFDYKDQYQNAKLFFEG